MFALPDRHALLDLLDGVSAGVERGTAMRMRCCDHDADLADGEIADAMDRHDSDARCDCDRLPHDRLHLPLRHPRVRGIFEPRDGARIGAVANGAEERRHRAGVGIPDLVGDGRHVDGGRGYCRPAHPPATGGMTATSSPGEIATSSVAYSSLTAIIGRGGSLGDSAATAVRTAPTVAGSGTVTVARSAPRASAYDAKTRTVTFTCRSPVRRAHQASESSVISMSAMSARSSLDGLNTGTGRAATSTGDPVRGFLAMRVLRCRILKVPNPRTSMFCCSRSASFIASRKVSTTRAQSFFEIVGPAVCAICAVTSSTRSAFVIPTPQWNWLSRWNVWVYYEAQIGRASCRER